MSLITFRIFISSSDSCVPSDYCKSYGCSTVLGNVFGGTSLIIMVGVAIDTIQQINSYLLNKHYDGLMKSGKIEKQ
jgi:preprotein translocase subunit SecY